VFQLLSIVQIYKRNITWGTKTSFFAMATRPLSKHLCPQISELNCSLIQNRGFCPGCFITDSYKPITRITFAWESRNFAGYGVGNLRPSPSPHESYAKHGGQVMGDTGTGRREGRSRGRRPDIQHNDNLRSDNQYNNIERHSLHK